MSGGKKMCPKLRDSTPKRVPPSITEPPIPSLTWWSVCQSVHQVMTSYQDAIFFPVFFILQSNVHPFMNEKKKEILNFLFDPIRWRFEINKRSEMNSLRIFYSFLLLLVESRLKYTPLLCWQHLLSWAPLKNKEQSI